MGHLQAEGAALTTGSCILQVLRAVTCIVLKATMHERHYSCANACWRTGLEDENASKSRNEAPMVVVTWKLLASCLHHWTSAWSTWVCKS